MFDRYHRDVNHWEELGYHFVIGNGVGAGDGQVEVGPRWAKQKTGAHAGVKEYNEFGIGICLVGDFSHTRPTAAQMQSLARLTGYLMQAYRIPANRVIGHRDAKHTNCPGRYMDLGMVRAMAVRVVEERTATARIE
jgi:N-acetyl-anhydromuramyl-L-alanine amidase AmpD